MGSKLFHPTMDRAPGAAVFNALLARLRFAGFVTPDRRLSAVLASSGGKFTDSLERDLDTRSRHVC